jgi:hypothetical protein
MRKRRTTLIAVAGGLILASCSGPGAEQLHNAARSLVPGGAAVVREREGDCVELAPSPSCVQLSFVFVTHLTKRESAVRAAADAGGWRLDRREVLPDGVELRFSHDDVRAIVTLRPPDAATRCTNVRSVTCADTVSVEGDYGV